MAGTKKANGQAAAGKNGEPETEKTEGPIVTAFMKRLRNARKRLNRITETELAMQAGKELNADQEEQLRSKPGVLSIIDELERVMPLMREAVKEENQATRKATQAAADAKADAIRAEAKAAAAAEAQAAIAVAKAEAESARKQAAAAAAAAEAAAAKAEAEAAASRGVNQEDITPFVERIVKLVYLAQLFDVFGFHYAYNERQSCLTYDYTVPTQGEPLSEQDLLNIGAFGKMITSRPQNKLVSHKEAMDSCCDLVVKFLFRQDHVVPGINMPVEHINERVQRVLASQYLTAQPTKVTVKEDVMAPEPAGLPPSAAQAMAGFLPMEHASMPAPPSMPTSLPGGIMLDQLERSLFQAGAAGAPAPAASVPTAPAASLPLGMVPPGGQLGGMPGAPPMQPFPFYGQQPGFMPLGAGGPGMPPPAQPGSHQQPGMPMGGLPLGTNMPGMQGLPGAMPHGHVPLPPAGAAVPAPPLPAQAPPAAAAAGAGPGSPQKPATPAAEAQPATSSAADVLPGAGQQQQQPGQGGARSYQGGAPRGAYQGGRGGPPGGRSNGGGGRASAPPPGGRAPAAREPGYTVEFRRPASSSSTSNSGRGAGGRGAGGRGRGHAPGPSGLNAGAMPFQAPVPI